MFIFIMGIFICMPEVSAQTGQDIKQYIATADQARTGMTLLQLLKAGGIIIVILFIFSILTVALIAYNFFTINEQKLVPEQFAQGIMHKLENGDVFSAREMSQEEDNIIARIVLAGLEKKKDGPVFTKEAMEFCARTEIATLWQNITYLGDIAAVTPLIGLLGTVIGMIQAFNVIAFQTAVVKPMLLAGGVSKAMVTTAGGLIVAIPALIFYSYFRAKVQRIANSIEGYSTDLIKFVNETLSNK